MVSVELGVGNESKAALIPLVYEHSIYVIMHLPES